MPGTNSARKEARRNPLAQPLNSRALFLSTDGSSDLLAVSDAGLLLYVAELGSEVLARCPFAAGFSVRYSGLQLFAAVPVTRKRGNKREERSKKKEREEGERKMRGGRRKGSKEVRKEERRTKTKLK